MDAEHSRDKEKRENPQYSYKDHVRYAEEKLKSVESLSEEQKRRFNDGAVKIISEIYGEHTGHPVNINKPPPIALDLSPSAKNATASQSREMPSASTSQPHSSTMLPRTPRVPYEQYRTRSPIDKVLVGKKSIQGHKRPRHQDHFKKQSRRPHKATSFQAARTAARPDIRTNSVSATTSMLPEAPPTLPRWYALPSKPIDVSEIVNVDSDDD